MITNKIYRVKIVSSYLDLEEKMPKTREVLINASSFIQACEIAVGSYEVVSVEYIGTIEW